MLSPTSLHPDCSATWEFLPPARLSPGILSSLTVCPFPHIPTTVCRPLPPSRGCELPGKWYRVPVFQSPAPCLALRHDACYGKKGRPTDQHVSFPQFTSKLRLTPIMPSACPSFDKQSPSSPRSLAIQHAVPLPSPLKPLGRVSKSSREGCGLRLERPAWPGVCDCTFMGSCPSVCSAAVRQDLVRLPCLSPCLSTNLTLV